MKYLGIDYGKKRTGLAVSSDDASIAFPLRVIEGGPCILNEAYWSYAVGHKMPMPLSAPLPPDNVKSRPPPLQAPQYPAYLNI